MPTRPDPELQGLKPGDRVAIRSTGSEAYRLAKVVRVTPGGQIVTDNDGRFRPDGRSTGNSSGWHWQTLCRITPEIEAALRRQALIATIDRRLEDWRDLPTPALERLAAALQKGEGTDG